MSVAEGGGEANRASATPVFGRAGGIAAFISDATNLVPADGNDASDVFVLDLASG